MFGLHHNQQITVAYSLGILGGFAFNCSIPLGFEMVLETVFPWGQVNAASSLVVFTSASLQIVFLLVPIEINGSAQWTGWVCTLSVIIAATMMLCVKIGYRRMKVDSPTFTSCRFDGAGCF